MLLTATSLPGIYAQPDTGLLRCLDHVHAEWTDAARTVLRIKNPTAFPARVRVLIEKKAATAQPLAQHFAHSLPVVEIPAGSQVDFGVTA